MKVLTTGTRSGLGKFFYEAFGGTAWTRHTSVKEREQIQRKGADVIIHCAFNSRQSVPLNVLNDYLQDNVFLTQQLVKIPHKLFVLISSVEVYPKGKSAYTESEMIDSSTLNGIYGLTKLMSEAIVQQHCQNHLTLRCTSLLGPYIRKNNLIRILEDVPCKLTLSGDSQLNCILYTDLLEFVRLALNQNLNGIYNVASSENVSLAEIASTLGKEVFFGEYLYQVGTISNNKIAAIFPVFRKTSREVILEFVKQKDLNK